MKYLAICILPVLAALALFARNLQAQQQEIALVEEDRAFWDDVLSDGSIKQKNVLYAGYIAYRENLSELSIESFRVCIEANPANEIVKGVAAYYIGKNLVRMGKYGEAIEQMGPIQGMDLARFNTVKFAVTLNTAVAYYRQGNMEKYREFLQRVISADIEGRYKRIALDMLSK
jgi:tetratricopeptide (TPR) repeat protein